MFYMSDISIDASTRAVVKLLDIIYFRHFGRHSIQHSCDGSISLSESVLVKVSGVDDDIEKEVLVSWSLQASSTPTDGHQCYSLHRCPSLPVNFQFSSSAFLMYFFNWPSSFSCRPIVLLIWITEDKIFCMCGAL